MIARTHGIALAALLGAASVAGAYATITTAKLGDSETKPEVVASAEIAKRRARLDEWETSLRKALAAKPPALPAIPRYVRAGLVSTPSYAGLPALSPPHARRLRRRRDGRVTTGSPGRRRERHASPLARAPQAGRRRHPPRTAPATTRDEAATPEPVAQAPATSAAPETAPPPPAAAPAPAPAPPSHDRPAPQPAPTTLSKSEAEKQCEALKRAAEGQGEAAKKDAERRCEELKKAAEGND